MHTSRFSAICNDVISPRSCDVGRATKRVIDQRSWRIPACLTLTCYYWHTVSGAGCMPFDANSASSTTLLQTHAQKGNPEDFPPYLPVFLIFQPIFMRLDFLLRHFIRL